jgi:hypothetical protein
MVEQGGSSQAGQRKLPGHGPQSAADQSADDQQAQGQESNRKSIVQPEPAFRQRVAGAQSVQATGISRRQRQEEGAEKQV